MDSFNFRVQIFDADGKFVSKFGGIGTGFGQFSKPKGIGVDSEGHIYVSDAAFNNVQIFDQEGRLLLFFGEMGRRRGQFWLPAGLAVDAHDRIYVADQYNKRINVYQYLPEAAAAGGEQPRMDQPSTTN
jgi:DNA-binding beta-propeller fold protein YncE